MHGIAHSRYHANVKRFSQLGGGIVAAVGDSYVCHAPCLIRCLPAQQLRRASRALLSMPGAEMYGHTGLGSRFLARTSLPH